MNLIPNNKLFWKLTLLKVYGSQPKQFEIQFQQFHPFYYIRSTLKKKFDDTDIIAVP